MGCFASPNEFVKGQENADMYTHTDAYMDEQTHDQTDRFTKKLPSWMDHVEKYRYSQKKSFHCIMSKNLKS